MSTNKPSISFPEIKMAASLTCRVEKINPQPRPQGLLAFQYGGGDRAEQRLRMCIDGRGLGSNLVSF